LPHEPDHEPPVMETLVEIFKGITYQKSRRFNANCHILIIDMPGKRFHVTPFSGLKVVSQVGRELRAPIVVNGDGWGINQRFPNSIAASDGNFYMRSQMDYRPWINISQDNKVSFAWRNPDNLYNAVSGDRYLIQNGKYNEVITNVTKDPRTVIGFSRQGKLILIVADGRTPQSAGLSFREVSKILLELDAFTAINLDGGGSSTMWINDHIVNIPIDQNIPGKERPVANHLCIFLDQ
jgi:exopolysaccharide biosynthesis protein